MSQLSALERTATIPRLRLVTDDAEAVILPFSPPARRSLPGRSARLRPRFSTADLSPPEGRMDLLTRARVLHSNRCCPHCGRASVIPIDLGDGDLRNHAMPIPGTSTLVGFSCDSCGAEWQI